MSTIEKALTVDAAFSQLFRGGEITRRELRLSEAEARQLGRCAQLTPLPGEADGKRWYEVRLKGEE